MPLKSFTAATAVGSLLEFALAYPPSPYLLDYQKSRGLVWSQSTAGLPAESHLDANLATGIRY